MLATVMARGLWIVLALVLSGSGCESCAEPEAPAIPEGISVAVSIDDAAATTIDSARLRDRAPDFQDGDHRSWRLESLVERYQQGRMTVELEESGGERSVVARPGEAGERIVVVAVNRAGAVRVGLVAASDPFPPFHGRGGNRGRGGDPSRVRDVKRIVLRSADR